MANKSDNHQSTSSVSNSSLQKHSDHKTESDNHELSSSISLLGQEVKPSIVNHEGDKHLVSKPTSSMSLRGVATFNPYDLYKRKSLSALPMRLSLRRLDAVRIKLAQCSDPKMVHFTQKCNNHINNWQNVSDGEKNNLSINMRYAAGVLCSATVILKLEQTRDHSGCFLQKQGTSNMCGLCCLNNMYQDTVFSQGTLDDIADDLWYQHWLSMEMEPIDPVQAMRSQIGDYSIDVLIGAIDYKGQTTASVTFAVNKFMKDNSTGEYLLSESSSDSLIDLIREDQRPPLSFLLKHCNYHYSCIRIDKIPTGIVVWLDSKKQKPINLTPMELHALFKREFLPAPASKRAGNVAPATAALFRLQSQPVTLLDDLSIEGSDGEGKLSIN